MKKIVRLFLINIFVIFNISIVKAESCEINLYGYKPKANIDIRWPGEIIETNADNNGTPFYSGAITQNNTTIHSNYPFYSLSDADDKLYSAYCRNPDASPTGSATGFTEFDCVSRLFDADDTNEDKKAYEYGIIAILKAGYNEHQKMPLEAGYNSKSYAATSLALRTFEILSPFNSNNITNSSSFKLKFHGYYAKKWENMVSGLYKTGITKNFGDLNYKPYWIYGSENPTSEIESEAEKLLKAGISAVNKYKQNGAASLKGLDKKPMIRYTDTKTTVTYTLKAEKFNSKDAYVKVKLNCKNCAQNNVTVSLNVPGSSQVADGYRQINKPNDGDIKITITFNKAKGNCPDINYELDVQWNDESINEAYDVKEKNCTDNINCQHFYVLVSEGPVKETIKNKINLCGKVDNCKTYIENAACSDTDSNIHINEGYEIESDCTTKEENVLKCIINHSDPAGNSYQVSENVHGNFEKVLDNDYCEVYCKEDYHFTLPGIKELNSGRYFSLKASISGTKTCYTSKIDKDNTFEKNVEIKRKAVINAWNEWNKWHTAYNTEPTTWTRRYSCSECPGCSENGYYIQTTAKKYNEYGIEGVNGVYYSNDGGDESCASKTCDWNGPINKETNEPTCGTRSCYGTSTCIAGNKTTLKSNLYTEKLFPAIDALNKAISEYIKIINDYNNCFGETTNIFENNYLEKKENVVGWKMDYDYNPTINFWYEESYMNDTINKTLSTNGGGIPVWIGENHYDDGLEKTTPIKFKELNNIITSDFVCYQTGKDTYDCSNKPIRVGQADYVKQSMNVNASYITPTQFYNVYPTGAIVVAEAGKNIENSKELTNMLPVGLGTNQDVYNYTLKVSNLGEYYNKDSLGRIWGDSNSVVVNTLKDEYACVKDGALKPSVPINGTTQSDGVYVCAYKVNCPNCPVVCDPDCKRPDCPNNNCPVECENCVYTNNNINIGYRPITPGNINPNDREMGINWKWDDKIETALELKAYVTSKEIEEAGEIIYDIDYEDTSVNEEFAMQVILDSKMINLIKSYNDRYENNDGYANDTLKCYDHTNSNDGKKYDNIYCYSTFIDEMIEKTGGPKENGGSDNIKIVGGKREYTDASRKTNTENSGYWTTWSQATNNKWITSTSIGFNYNKNYKTDTKEEFKGLGIGPAWK